MTAVEIVLLVLLAALWLIFGLCKAAAAGDRQLDEWAQRCPDEVDR